MEIYVVYKQYYDDFYIERAYRERVDAENALKQFQEDDPDFSYYLKEVELWWVFQIFYCLPGQS